MNKIFERKSEYFFDRHPLNISFGFSKNGLNETILLSTHNKCYDLEMQ